MKTLILILLALITMANPARLKAQGTAFTYQGQLYDSGSSANGSYDLQFTLYNAPDGGYAISGTVTNLAVGVTNGLFTTTLDFGAAVYGNAIWLAISVSPNGANNYVSLTPLQALTPTPSALYATSAGSTFSANYASQAYDFTGPLAGDVTGYQNSTTITSLGGLPAATVASGATAANNATSANSPGTIVARDASGNFSAGTISGIFVGDGSGLSNLPAIGSSETTINNTTANPVPVTVQNTPLPVINVQPNQPFQAYAAVTIPAGSASATGNTLFTVPAGKRLVIESISIYLANSAASSITSFFFQTVVSGGIGYHGLTIPADGTTYPLGNLNAKFYADPGSSVYANVYRTGVITSSESAFVTVTGYYIND